MRIWIDLANSPHVPFFGALIPEFNRRGHDVEVTARDFAETVALAKTAGLNAKIVGGHGGKAITGKAGNLISRARALRKWARGRGLDLAVSHNSYSQILATRTLRLKCVTLMDYEHQPANHLAFRLASRVIVPQDFPDESLRRYGAEATKVKRYSGTKEDVYLANFQADPGFENQLRALGVEREDILVVVRPPATDALYHRFENRLFDDLLTKLLGNPSVKVLLLPRGDAQRSSYAIRGHARLILPMTALDGPNLIAASDLVISGGGTMNREAAALGIPVATIYAGKWAAVDEALYRSGRMRRIRSTRDLEELALRKKEMPRPRKAMQVQGEVADLILEGY